MFQISPQVKLGSYVLVMLIILLGSSKFIQGPFSAQSAVLGISIPQEFWQFSSNFSFTFQSSGLSQVIQDQLKDSEGEYAVYIEHLQTEEKYGFNEHTIFPAASLYKVFLIAAVLKEIELSAISHQSSDNNVIPTKAGIQLTENSSSTARLSLDTKISASKDHLTGVLGEVDYGYEDAPETITYTVEEALQRVGRISDNFAAIMLAEKIGWDKVQDMVDSLGSTSTRIQSPISTTAADIGNLFKKLYRKEVVSAAVSEKVLELLALNQLNNRLPAKLPEDVKIVHKTGELSRVRHDGGIVYLSPSNSTPEESLPVGAPPSGVFNRAYVIVLFSKNLQYEDDGVETLATISKDVYEYFKGKE